MSVCSENVPGFSIAFQNKRSIQRRKNRKILTVLTILKSLAALAVLWTK